MAEKFAFSKIDMPPSAAYLTHGVLYRAIVACPADSPDTGYDERVIFFEAPRTEPNYGRYLEQLLSRVWCVDTTGWLDRGAIYNIDSFAELFERALGDFSTGDMRLFETGAGGRAGAIHYAGTADVELYVSPRAADQLRDMLYKIDEIHGATDWRVV